MHFALKGKSVATSQNFRNIVKFDSYQHNIIYAHHLQGKMEFYGPDLHILEINLAPEFFKSSFRTMQKYLKLSEILLKNSILH